MKKLLQVTVALCLSASLFAPSVFAQEDQAAPAVAAGAGTNATEEPEVSSSQEVGINEDNYRQFMELKDNNPQRGIIPEEAFKPGTGLQKLEKLPEESQKHLRNELREIIVQGEPWQPGDEQDVYPYVPSQAAEGDPALQKQEIEAWGELVDSYHQREAQIYENASGSRAARGSEDGNRNTPGEGAGADGSAGQSEEGKLGQQAGQQGKPEQPGTAGTYSPNASNDPNASSTNGVSQNAMEFLQGLGQNGSETGEVNEANSAENSGKGQSPASSGTGSQAQTGQQGSTGQENAANGSPVRAAEPNATSMAGISQNAMEFLKGSSGQGEAAGEGSTAAAQARQDQGETQADEQGLAQAEGQQNGQDTAQADGQADAQGEGQDDGQAQDGQQTATAQTSASSAPPASTTPTSTSETEEESTTGASQNALEYLTGEHVQASETVSEEEQATGQPQGTLTIQDLLNAQGVGDSTGTAPLATPAKQQPAKDKPEEDGGG